MSASGFRFQAAGWLPASITFIAISGIVIWWLQHRAGLGGKRAAWLALWRWSVLALLSLCLAKPSIVRTAATTSDGDWIVLLDQSRSMSVSDTARPPARCVALAQATGLLQPETRTMIGAELIEQARAMGALQDGVETTASELDFAQLAGHGVPAASQRLTAALHTLRDAAARLQQRAMDQSNAAALFGNCREIVTQIDRQLNRGRGLETNGNRNNLAWLQLLRRLVNGAATAAQQPQDAADSTLYNNDADARAAADDVGDMARSEIASRIVSNLSANQSGNVHWIEYGATPALPGLTIADESFPGATGDTSDINGAIAAAESRASATDARAIILLSDGRQVGGSAASGSMAVPIIAVNAGLAARQDVAIAQADVPSVVYQNESVTTRVIVQSNGARDQSVEVVVSDGNTKWSQRAICTEYRTIVSVPFQLDSAGMHELRIRVIPSTPDAHPENNQVVRWIRVFDEPIHVGLLASNAEADADALRNALQTTSWIRNEPVTPATPTQQVIVLHNVQSSQLTSPQWTALTKWVRAGGGLILVAGPDTVPSAFQGNADAAAILPWRLDASPQWRNEPTDAGAMHLIATDPSIVRRFSDNAVENRKHWEQLPAIHNVLLIDGPKPGVVPLLTEEKSGQAVVTEQRLDAGRVVFVGFFEAYRWRNLISDREADRFWLSLIRRVVEPPYAASNVQYLFDAEPAAAAPGKTINLRVLRKNHGDLEMPAVSLIRNGETIGSVSLHPASKSDVMRLVGTTVLAEAGDYECRLESTPPLMVPIHVAVNDEAEMLELNPDEDNLRRLARASGGDYLRLDEASSLPSRVDEVVKRSPRVSIVPLWDSASVYWIALGGLLLEWAGRKRVGLV